MFASICSYILNSPVLVPVLYFVYWEGFFFVWTKAIRQNHTNQLKYKVILCKCQKEENISVVDKIIRKVKKNDGMKPAWLNILLLIQ